MSKENDMKENAERYERYRRIGEQLKEIMPKRFDGLDSLHVGELATWIANGSLTLTTSAGVIDNIRDINRVVREVGDDIPVLE